MATLDTACEAGAGWPIRPRILGFLIALVALIVLLLRACTVIERPAHEIAFPGQCVDNMRSIYEALVEYRQARGNLPDKLNELAQRGMIEQRTLHCPNQRAKAPGGPAVYGYPPEAWGTASRLLTEDCRNHGQQWPWYTKLLAGDLPTACYALF